MGSTSLLHGVHLQTAEWDSDVPYIFEDVTSISIPFWVAYIALKFVSGETGLPVSM